MTYQTAEIYLKELAVTHQVKLYESSNASVLFPIGIKINEDRMKVEHGYVCYLIDDDEHIYAIQIFIDANMNYGALMRIFGQAVINFRNELKKLVSSSSTPPSS